jgi:hypothetical protein
MLTPKNIYMGADYYTPPAFEPPKIEDINE